MIDDPKPRPLIWLGSTRKDIGDFPDEVKAEIGYGLFQAQLGGRHRRSKPLSGFGSAGVVEIVTDFRGDAFRAVYTVRFASVIYVLHAFQKKSKKGAATPKADLELIQRRLRDAEAIEKGEIR